LASAVLVGSETLMGREIRDLWGTESKVPLSLIGTAEEVVGKLTVDEDELTVIGALDPIAIAAADVALLAGSPESTLRTVGFQTETHLVDLTYAAEENPLARLRAPMMEPHPASYPPHAIHVIAHPAAIALSLVLGRIHANAPIRRSVAHVFEPASERGKKGIEELQQQTVNLLSFKGLPKKIYDAQLAFNLLTRFGDEAPEALETWELRIERHLASLLAETSTPPPSLRLIQAPVFHGHSASLWIELEQARPSEDLERLLEGSPIDVRGSDLEPPDIVGFAGQNGISVGALSIDRNHPNAFWLWIVSDNLRLMAQNAILVANELL
jgi:aspartate-semialdehyde dehydrogenase